MIPQTAQARALVILGLEEENSSKYISTLNDLSKESYFSKENTKIEGSVGLSIFDSTKTVNELVGRLNNIKINGKQIQALSVPRYMAMYSVGKRTSMQGQTVIKPAVKKIIGEKEVAAWKSESLGEQFVIYSEGTFSNYQLSKMFPCKLLKSKVIKDVSVTEAEDLIIVQKQKNIFVYGGYLDLLDGFAACDPISCYTIGRCIVIEDRPEPNKKLWTIHNLYSKKHIKSIEMPDTVRFAVSKNLTHYLLSHDKTIEIRSMSTDENIFPAYSQEESGKQVEGFVSPHDNVVFVVRSSETSTEWFLHCLTTGKEIRKKSFASIESYKVTFAEGEVAIVNVRNMTGKECYFMDIWSIDGQAVVSKALGENIKSVHPSKYTTVVVGQAACKVYKRVQSRLIDGVTIKEPISEVKVGETTILLDSTNAYIIGGDGEILNKIEVTGTENIKVSPFGLYIALLSGGQVRIVDICGKEVFVGNIERENGFFWRTVVKPVDTVLLQDEEIQKYKEEDTLRKKEAKKQFMKENEEKIQEWREFLASMVQFRDSCMAH